MLYLTYSQYIDGMCAQYQRIIGIIALAESYGCTYLHTPIKQMEHVSQDEIVEIENFLQINSYYKKEDSIIFNYVHRVSNMEIEGAILHFKSQSNTTNTLLMINNPLAILDANIQLYNKVMPMLRNIKKGRDLIYFNKNAINIAVHIRRGDVSKSQYPDRYLPTSYFKPIIDKLLLQFPGANVCIFTEITPENREEFNIFTNIKIISGGDVLITFEHLSKADILITSKSSFSYVAALYNGNTVLYTNFWHKPLPHWKLLYNY
jgi:hypothetical protein